MNKERRKRIENAIANLQDVMEEVCAIQEEEQDAFDNLPEGIQESSRGELMQETVDGLDNVASDLDDVISNLQEVLDNSYS